MNSGNRCPRCEGRLQSWTELDDEEREMVKRLPGSGNYSLDERKARHRWCVRCWYEDKGGSPTLV
jgi:Zn ribbon nucleic-acid-binding protein